MKSCKRTAFLAVLCASFLLFSCGGRDLEESSAPSGDTGDVSGYFADVEDALDELAEKTAEVKSEWDKKGGVSRNEWRLSEDAVARYYLPLTETDYYYYEDMDEDVLSADPLMRIFLDEWGEYRSLSVSMDSAVEMTPEVRGETDALAAEAVTLLAETPPIHRDMVRRIIGLRYRNLLMKAGVNPEEIP